MLGRQRVVAAARGGGGRWEGTGAAAAVRACAVSCQRLIEGTPQPSCAPAALLGPRHAFAEPGATRRVVTAPLKDPVNSTAAGPCQLLPLLCPR